MLEEGACELPAVGLRQRVLITEDTEDVEHRCARLVLERTLCPNDGQQAIQRRLIFGSTCERFGEFDAQAFILRIGSDAGFDFSEIAALRRLQPGRRIEAVDLCVGHETPQHDEGLVRLASVDEERGQTRAGLRMVRLLIEDLPENVLGGHSVIRELRGAGLVHHEIEFGGEDALDPPADRRLRQCPGERIDGRSVAEREHHWNALDAVLGSQLLVRIHVDLDEIEGAFGFGCDLLEDGAKDPARLTPFGPEVDHNGYFAAPLEHFLGEVCGVYVLCEFTRSGHRGKNTGGPPATVVGMESRPEAPFGQVLTAVITPFGDDGSIDYGTFWRLTRFLADHGSDGIVVGGTTGESPTLSKVEKVALFKAAVDAAGDRMKVIAGAGTYDTRESVDLAQRAADSGVHGIMAVTPYYSKPPQEGLFRHFTAIADATELPLMLYNIPGRTCRIIEIDTLVRLAAHPNIVAVKDAVEDLDFTRQALEALPDGFAVYSGSDSMAREMVRMGGVGVVSVAAHLAGDQIKSMVDAAIGGNDELADHLNGELGPLFEALFLEPNPMPLKAGLDLAWDPVGDPRLPLIPASDDTRTAIERALAALSGA